MNVSIKAEVSASDRPLGLRFSVMVAATVR
jgi:hypothetical protein